MKHLTKEELERFKADCNRGGICRLDMESAVRNHIVPPAYSPDDRVGAWLGDRGAAAKKRKKAAK